MDSQKIHIKKFHIKKWNHTKENTRSDCNPNMQYDVKQWDKEIFAVFCLQRDTHECVH